MARLLLLNGPNLNLLGRREPGVYGAETLADIEQALRERSVAAGHTLECLQSNSESVLVERVQCTLDDGTAFVIINPGALTHTSVALRDAFLATRVPFVEVHISNIFAREAFRHRSYLSDVAAGVIVGLGTTGYALALEAVLRRLAADSQAAGS